MKEGKQTSFFALIPEQSRVEQH